MRTLDAADKMEFDKHLLLCKRCVAEVNSAAKYIRAMRPAARILRNADAGRRTCGPRSRLRFRQDRTAFR